jgi:hypothetical protein
MLPASRVTRALTRQSDALVRSAGRSRKRLGEPNAPDRSPRARSGLLSSSGLRSASRAFIGPHTPRCLPTPASETGEGIGTGLFSAGPGTIFAAPRYPTGGILDSPPKAPKSRPTPRNDPLRESPWGLCVAATREIGIEENDDQCRQLLDRVGQASRRAYDRSADGGSDGELRPRLAGYS